ncbi:hypothetical protein D9758_002268 [Tetrapyrgos nigripes]|uniref:Conserved oligomeric Golgi complex subunit 1 n=1 Tax=Tetrapyrgos nigripes TaxID=182062 RepID=A0A8H5LT50_9AGAR|nr:hypothetical protein D9758_002268 [Tetrapyrgos nigripes]
MIAAVIDFYFSLLFTFNLLERSSDALRKFQLILVPYDMSRRPSLRAASNSSISTLTLGNGSIPEIPQSQSGTAVAKSLTQTMDPDELFSKHTIAEIKQIQHRLSVDANAKQEELRVMVGERYRDLLQSSASIISIAESSKRVIEILKDAKETILSEAEPSPPKRAHTRAHSEDAHLHMLQILAAHLKLLLDTPEHLWRLLEKKNYYTAAWLFLLSRVVHRALVHEDEQDEEAWNSYGIDVLEQFPLVQRQWDAVAQFRSQIVHKATLSLRKYTTSSVDTCATLLTLHLLDSRPLGETLTVFLGQRWKSLQIMLGADKIGIPLSASRSNGHIPSASPTSPSQSRKTVRQVKDLVLASLDAVSRTVKVAREVYQDKDSRPSMIKAALESIQSDDSQNESLPTELQLSTQSILTGLPSSTQFQLLPASLRSYKPYVDSSSSSSSLPKGSLHKDLDEWFQKAFQRLKTSFDTWLTDIHSVKTLWIMRASVRSWIDAFEGLEEGEARRLKTVIDDACRRRILNIWKSTLTEAESSFRSQLTSAISSFKTEGARIESFPIEFLFSAPPLPTSSPTSTGSLDASFQKYRSSLRRQLLGHTTLLDGVLKTLEQCAKVLRQDLFQVLTGKDDTTLSLIDELKEAYHLKSAAEGISDNSDIDALIFTGHIIEKLLGSSNFLTDISCQESAVKEFQQNARIQYDSILNRWREFSVSTIIGRHKNTPKAVSSNTSPCSPSTHLLQSLLSLAETVQGLGISRTLSEQVELVQQTLLLFIRRLMSDVSFSNELQTLYDLAFLKTLANSCTSEPLSSLDDKAMQIREKESNSLPTEAELSKASSECLSRYQLLLASLLVSPTPSLPSPSTSPPVPPPAIPTSSSGEKFVTLLQLGTPPVDQEYKVPFDIAKPSSRFGLLLVG